MLKYKIFVMIGAIALTVTSVHAGQQTPWTPAGCKTLNQGSVTIKTVTKMGVAPFDPAGGINMMEISGTTDAGGPISVRFKIVKENCAGCSAIDLQRVDSANLTIDNARMAMAMKKPLQFMESGVGALCNVSPDTTNLKIYEIRDINGGSTLLPPGMSAVGSMPGVANVIFPDDSTIAD